MPRKLHRSIHLFLVMLDRAHLDGAEWIHTNEVVGIGREYRQIALKKGFVEAEGQTSQRRYRLTAAGRTALADNAEFVINELRTLNSQPEPTAPKTDDAFVGMGLVPSTVPDPAPVIVPVPAAEPVAAVACTPDCACTYRQAFDLAAAKIPALHQLKEALEAINQL